MYVERCKNERNLDEKSHQMSSLRKMGRHVLPSDTPTGKPLAGGHERNVEAFEISGKYANRHFIQIWVTHDDFGLTICHWAAGSTAAAAVGDMPSLGAFSIECSSAGRSVRR